MRLCLGVRVCVWVLNSWCDCVFLNRCDHVLVCVVRFVGVVQHSWVDVILITGQCS
jgi:hypothetical protein